MVGKPNSSADVDSRGNLHGSSSGTPGLTPLDEEREASLADEGGAAGAAVESQDLDALKRLAEGLPVAHLCPPDAEPPAGRTRGRLKAVAAVAAAAGAAGLIARRLRG
jgi:hypothetical protein